MKKIVYRVNKDSFITFIEPKEKLKIEVQINKPLNKISKNSRNNKI
jgi:hypothetical protein